MDQSKSKCPCCGEFLKPRQIYRHLANYVDRARLEDSALDDVGIDPGVGAGEYIDVGHEVGQEPAQGPINMNPSDANPAVPPLEPAGFHWNPPVTIENWPEPFELEASDDDEEHIGEGPLDGPDRDPKYTERDTLPRFDPGDEPEFTDNELRALLEAELGDIADAEWKGMYSSLLSKKDRKTLELLATRLRTHFSRQTWDDLRQGVCEELDLPSEFVAWRRLRILSGLETRAYDCCINSCCCFLGKYKDENKCPFCNEQRYNPRGKARRTFRYTPLVPQLRGLFQSSDMAAKLRYRVNVEREYEPGVIQDVFDGENYRALRETPVCPDGEYRFFDNPEDVALGLSTDGFTLFKRRRRGHSTAWPIILINYNLHPRIRTRLENVICVGVIPGPKQCKDLNSFLVPLLEELLELERGVEFSGRTPTGRDYVFVFHAFIIIIFGDIPAVTKLLLIKGHNALTPCRACYIQGVLCQLRRTSVYYVPLMRPHQTIPFPCDKLPMRTKQLFLIHLDAIEAQQTETARETLRRDVGINARSIFTLLKSVDLPSSLPYDIMHLFFENLVPNMIRHWTGKFKGLDQGTENYQLSTLQWDAIGRLTAQATRTIPSAFVGTLPDIAQDITLYKAEAYAFWFQYIAPILLKDQLPNKYYEHFLLMREIMLRCLQFQTTAAEIDELQIMINTWVTDYEKYYYQYRASRLPTCPLTIHALPHIPYYLRRTGPLWASWAFVMERFCGRLLPAVKNRVRPYEHLDNFVQRRAQMQVVSKIYDLPSLAKPKVNFKYVNGVEMSSRETVYPEFPDIILGTPVNKRVQPNTQLMNQLTKYFGVVYQELRGQQLRDRIDLDSLVRYGRFRLAGDGDSVRTAALIDSNPIARDNSYVKYDLLPDRNAAYRNRPDAPYRQTQYGQLLDIYYVKFVEDDGTREPYLLARVKECKTDGRDAALPRSPVVTYTRTSTPDIVHLSTIVAVVGRIQMGNTWAIVDRSRDNARTSFVDEEGNDEYD